MATSNPYIGQALTDALERVERLQNGDRLTNQAVTNADHLEILKRAHRHIIDAGIHDQEGFHGRDAMRSSMYRAQEALADLGKGKDPISDADQRRELYYAQENLKLAVAIAEGRTVGMTSIRSPSLLAPK